MVSASLVLAGLLVSPPVCRSGGRRPRPGRGRGTRSPEVRLPGGTPASRPAPQSSAPADGSATDQRRRHPPSPHPAALAAFADAVSDPGSPSYRHYLTTRQFATTFGAVPGHADRRQGLAGVGPVSRSARWYADGLMIPVTGTVAAMEQAFAVPLVDARLPGGRVARVEHGGTARACRPGR